MQPEPHVVAAVDFSDISPAVVHSARRLAGKIGAACTVAHVVEALQGGEEEGPLLPFLRRRVEDALAEADRSVEDLLRDAGGEEGAPLHGRVLRGWAFSSLIGLARELSAFCLVLGGPPPSRQLGTTAERIIRKSPLPVLVVRRPPAAGYQHLCVGVDFSPGSEASLRLARQIAEPGAHIVACHVVNTWGLPRSDEMMTAGESIFKELRSRAASVLPDAAVECRVEWGVPKTTLVEVAREIEAEVLVVGSRGKSPLSHLLLGSVAESAVRQCPCDVLVAGEERTDFCLP